MRIRLSAQVYRLLAIATLALFLGVALPVLTWCW